MRKPKVCGGFFLTKESSMLSRPDYHLYWMGGGDKTLIAVYPWHKRHLAVIALRHLNEAINKSLDVTSAPESVSFHEH